MMTGREMKELTEKQEAVLRFVAEHQAAYGYPPTNREIATHFEITAKAAHDHILALERKGAVRVRDRISRSIEILKNDNRQNPDFFDIPIAGDIAAGLPLMSEENIDGRLRLPDAMLKSGAVYFAMRVRGDSMTDAGILPGDMVVIEKKDYADNGQIVAAVMNDAITLKRFFREHGRIKLQAENAEYQPIYTTDVHIVGILALVFRHY
jgi:repressor LexA